MMWQNKKRKFFFTITVLILFLIPSAYAFRNMMNGKRFLSMWTWIGGTSSPGGYGNYGVQGSSAATPPIAGARQNACTWTDASGNKWFFGGYAAIGNNIFNDLWKYDPTADQWFWMSGSSSPNASANYGVQGVPAATNVPGARQGCVSWIDASGNLWMFGGNASSSYFNDFWKYNVTTNQWTWITGSNLVNQPGTYGTQGVASAANTPGARTMATIWKDVSGNFWMFGGSNGSYYNDLWKFNISNNQWAWIGGTNGTGIVNGVYGTKGSSTPVLPLPGARSSAASCFDPSSGDQWFFGGNSISSSYYNDLWKHNPSTDLWTWMSGSNLNGGNAVYGSKGVAAAANVPGARSNSTCWIDNSGNFWLFGGLIPGTPQMNDLWKFDISTNQWTWMAGSNTFNQPATYGTQGVAAAANTPGCRYSSAGWTDASGNLWLFGGFNLNDLWKFDTSINQWMWVSGVNSNAVTFSIYGTQGSSAPTSVTPGARYSGAYFADSNNSDQWLYGGNASGFTNDLWKFSSSTNQWTWTAGASATGTAAVYGTKGVAAVSNTPGARSDSVGWTDASGNLWVFGGYMPGYYNDLWKFDVTTNQWTWMTGSSTANPVAVYGTKGVASSTTVPGGKMAASSWRDSSGNLWLFGGVDISGWYNDLWKYDPGANQWTWMTGANTINGTGVYGTKGVAAVSNTPGARQYAASTQDASGTLWLFGGSGSGSPYNDLWKFDPSISQWTWVSGASGTGQVANYGTLGVAAGTNVPGARSSAVIWFDSGRNNLWMFGGANSTLRYNDLWKFDLSTNQWTWMAGSSSTNQFGTYGTKGVAAVSNTPGARSSILRWTDTGGNLWLFGGYGFSSSGTVSNLNDVWKFDTAVNQWAWMNGSNISDSAGIYGTKGSSATVAPYPGSRFSALSWKDASGSFWLFGGTGYGSTYSSGNLNDLWKFNPTTNEWMWMSGGVAVSIYGVYGTKGVASATTFPGSRYGGAGWSDSSGKVWIFGGSGFAASGSVSYLNDLWKYDPAINKWTWTSGSNGVNSPGAYGTQGVGSSANFPGARYAFSRWSDASGNLWLHGGNGYSASGTAGYLNDLWKFNTATGDWTWTSGSTNISANGIYGTKGSASATQTIPGSRYGSAAWTDSNGIFWLHGGFGNGEFELSGSNNLNDLWKYDSTTNIWTWLTGSTTINQSGVYGTQGVAAVSNTPGARQAASTWVDASDKLWMFGGTNGNRFNDLWKYDPTTNQWTWMTGSNGTNASAVYGTQGVAAAANTPSARYSASAWTYSANYFWIFGGSDVGAVSDNDLWKYDPGTNQWTWVAGANSANANGVYGVVGTSAAVLPMPIARSQSTTWKDASGNFWMFGGHTGAATLNDLWKYNPTLDKWTWMSGSNMTSSYGTYGTKGVASSTTVPGARYSPMSWTDASGNLWLFGGYGYASASQGNLNDLWKFDTTTNQWTWMAGSNGVNSYGTYGVSGTPTASTTPGGRYGGATWIDASNNFWLLGGTGYASGTTGSMNDFWKFDTTTNQWTWISGSSSANQVGTYGTQGVSAPTNIPGARNLATTWTDSGGNFWLFGGSGYPASGGSGSLYDLWKYEFSSGQWTWMKGPNTVSNYGTYGSLGRDSATTQPGGRDSAIGWIDANDNLWLFGGWGYAASSFQYLGDLWKYSPTTNRWTWMSGSSSTNVYGVYGTLQSPTLTTMPGSRQNAMGWLGPDGNLWLFGGVGYSSTSTGRMNDFWKYRLK